MVDDPIGRFEAAQMIEARIDKYDVKQEARHKENKDKLDQMTYLIIVTLLATLGGLLTIIITHLMK